MQLFLFGKVLINSTKARNLLTGLLNTIPHLRCLEEIDLHCRLLHLDLELANQPPIEP